MSKLNKSRSLVVFEEQDDQPKSELRDIELGELASGRVRVQLSYSSLNYKDALCCSGHPGVARNLPLVPGIDAAGTVAQSNDSDFAVGAEVMIFHAEFGTKVDGGYSQFADVPSEYLYPLPPGLSGRDAMIIGTAGFTAAQSVDELIRHQIEPDAGPIVVSGATGGVGIMSVKLLSKLGYEVVASTGKAERAQWLKELGASQVVDRSAINDQSDTPLLKGHWAGAVDTVGGNTLATILRATKPHGCVTACGLVGGAELAMTVHPFILRGVTLQGIDTATIGREYRSELWQRMAGEWKFEALNEIATECSLETIGDQIAAILNGEVAGRVLVNLQN